MPARCVNSTAALPSARRRVHLEHEALALTDVSRDLAGIIDRAADDHEPVLITRGDGKPAAVLMSFENFALRRPANAQALRASIAELEAGRGVERS